MSNEIIYTWTFSTEKNRWQLWYIIWLSIVVALVIWGFLSKQYWMSFVIILLSWFYFFMENNTDDEITVNISELWINIWNNFYDYSRIISYSFIYNGQNAESLRLELTNKWIRNIDLKVDNQITSELKNILINFLEENPKAELSFSEKIIKLLKL